MLVGVQVLLQLQMKQIKLIATEATLAVPGGTQIVVLLVRYTMTNGWGGSVATAKHC